MTNNEIVLLDMIRNNANPEQALVIATKVIIDFLSHLESTESKSSAESQESV